MAALPQPAKRTVVLKDEALRRLKGFTQVPNAVLRHPHLSHGAKLTFGVLLSYAWQEDFCRPAQDTLAADMGCSIRHVRRFLSDLKLYRLVDWKQQGLNRPNVYYILPQNGWIFGNQSADGTDLSAPDGTDSSFPDRSPAAVQDGTPVSDKEYPEKNNNNVNNVDRSLSLKEESRRRRRLSREEYVTTQGLALQIQDTIGQPENFPAYFARASEAVLRGSRGVEALMEVLSITKDMNLSGRLKKTPSQYFQGAWQRVLPTLGPEVPIAAKESPATDAAERSAAKTAIQEFLNRSRSRG